MPDRTRERAAVAATRVHRMRALPEVAMEIADVKPPRCARCEGAMVIGMVIGRGHYSLRTVPSWVAGAPQKGWLGGLKVKGWGSELPVVTFRCERCGFLESYAPPRLFSPPRRD